MNNFILLYISNYTRLIKKNHILPIFKTHQIIKFNHIFNKRIQMWRILLNEYYKYNHTILLTHKVKKIHSLSIKRQLSLLKMFIQQDERILVFNFLKYINFKRLLVPLSLNKLNFSLQQRVFLNSKIIYTNTIKYLYKNQKKNLNIQPYFNEKINMMKNKQLNLLSPLFNSIQHSKIKRLISLNYHKYLL
ncbi:MAG: hypothetical protein KC550_05705 [Nanoarchaeota archaeon]|nr:hypothetical protein [Nanoarchaeota archaeon]